MFFLFIESLSESTNLEHLISPLIASVSHLMQESEIECTKSYNVGMSIYSVLISDVTGESPDLGIIRRSLIQIESYLKVEPSKSKLINRK